MDRIPEEGAQDDGCVAEMSKFLSDLALASDAAPGVVVGPVARSHGRL